MLLAGRLLASLSMLLLGAHFLRSGGLLSLAGCVALMALAWVPRLWAKRAVQAGLVLGALEWVRTLLDLVAERQALGAPWQRLAIILGAVAAAALLAAGLLGSKGRSQANQDSSPLPSAIG